MNPIQASRRQLLSHVAASTLAAAAPAFAKHDTGEPEPDPYANEVSPVAGAGPLGGEALFRDVERYAALGEHRTASEGDLRTSRWIAAELGAAGFDVALKPFTLRQYFDEATELHIEVDGDRVTPLEKAHENNRLFACRLPLARARLAFADVPDLQLTPTEMLSLSGGGELTHAVQAGYAAVGMVGDHRYFHTPQDLPAVTSPALLEPYGRAFGRLITSFVNHEEKS